MILAISSLILSLPWIVEAALDLYDAKKLGKYDNHDQDIWVLRIPAAGLASIANVIIFPNEFIWPVHLLQSGLLTIGLFVLCFDMTMGLVLKKDPFFLGGSSKFDIFLKQWPKVNVLFARLVIFIITFLIYTQLDYILS